MELSKSTGMGLSGRHVFLHSLCPQTLPHPTGDPRGPWLGHDGGYEALKSCPAPAPRGHLQHVQKQQASGPRASGEEAEVTATPALSPPLCTAGRGAARAPDAAALCSPLEKPRVPAACTVLTVGLGERRLPATTGH